MIVGIGTDIIEIVRFKRTVGNKHFVNRCYTGREQDYFMNRGKAAIASMAGFFAAKEAVVKALGTGFHGFWPVDVEILHDESGKPYTVLHGEAAAVAEKLCLNTLHVSISHCETYATAMATVERV